jgi:hypothetical protein
VECRPRTGASSATDGPWRPGVVCREKAVLFLRDPLTLTPLGPVARRQVRRVWRDRVLVAAVAFPRGIEPVLSEEMRGAL